MAGPLSRIVPARPYVPPPPPIPPEKITFFPLIQRWIGWDDTVWNISDDKSGVFVVNSDVRGFAPPPGKDYRDNSPAVQGARWYGFVADPREVSWPVYLYHDGSSEEWVARDSAFWRTLRRSETGIWEVQMPFGGGQTRRLRLRYNGTGSDTYTRDPLMAGWSSYVLPFLADQPYWEGDPVTWGASTGTQVGFFGTTAVPKGPPFTISTGAKVSSRQIQNPGDIATHVVWTLEGPFDATGQEVGRPGRTIYVPFSLPANRALVIDPRYSLDTSQTAFEADIVVDSSGKRTYEIDWDAERTTDLRGSAGGNTEPDWDGSLIEPGETANLIVNITGPAVRTYAQLTPLYERAW